MSKFLKKCLLAGVILLLVGGLVFLVSFASTGFDIRKMSGSVITEGKYTELGKSDSIVLNIQDSDLTVRFYDGEKITVDYMNESTERGKLKSEVTVTEENGSLVIREKTSWVMLSIFDFTSTRITVSIPKGREVSIDSNTDNGDVVIQSAEGASLLSLSVDTDNGDIDTRGELSVLGKLELETDNGDVSLDFVRASSLKVVTDNGEIDLRGGQIASDARIETDNGDIDIDGILVAESFSVETDNGDIGGDEGVVDARRITVESDNGDVEMRLAADRAAYTVTVKTSTGMRNIESGGSGDRALNIRTSNGDIEISFAN